MTEKGRIREIQEKTVTVTPDIGAACFGCMNKECRSRGGIIAENSFALPLLKGQMVEVTAPRMPVLMQALTALLPPVLGFITGYICAALCFPLAGEAVHAGAGVIFLFAAAFIVYAIRKRKPAGKTFVVTRIIEDQNKLSMNIQKIMD
jgi:sigma-E factor negative regulatory protein RseC